MTQERSRDRFIAFAVVGALHFLFLWMLWVRESVTRGIAHNDRSSVLFFIDAPRPAATAPPVQAPAAVQPRPTATAAPIQSEETSAAPESSVPSSPAIDWTAQATQAAAAIVDKTIREETRKCDPEDRPKSFLPPCHRKPPKQFKWQEPRAGFSGGLPYVRVGERCVIALGFFGCGFGGDPPANGDLFEDMDDPERERGSVPSSDP
jgi:hypothetical protein